MQHKVLEIVNKEGLSARAAAVFVQTAGKFGSQIFIEKGNKKINAKSVMGVLSLSVRMAESIHITTSGEDEAEAMQALVAVVKSGFEL